MYISRYIGAIQNLSSVVRVLAVSRVVQQNENPQIQQHKDLFGIVGPTEIFNSKQL